jgi:hypothetical protein
VRYATNRGQNQDIAAKFLAFENKGEFVGTKRASLDRLVSDYREKDLESAAPLRDAVKNVLDRMKRVFSTRDPLLSSQGVLSVYYWFIRQVPDNQVHLVRPFLVAFNEALRANKSAALNNTDAQEADVVDPVLAEYALLARSTNDQGSLLRRFRILADRFDPWLRTQRTAAS